MSYGDSNCKCHDDTWCGCLDNPTLNEILATEHQRTQARADVSIPEAAATTQLPAPAVSLGVWMKSIGTGGVIGALSLLLPIPPAFAILVAGIVAALALPAFNMINEQTPGVSKKTALAPPSGGPKPTRAPPSAVVWVDPPSANVLTLPPSEASTPTIKQKEAA